MGSVKTACLFHLNQIIWKPERKQEKSSSIVAHTAMEARSSPTVLWDHTVQLEHLHTSPCRHICDSNGKMRKGRGEPVVEH